MKKVGIEPRTLGYQALRFANCAMSQVPDRSMYCVVIRGISTLHFMKRTVILEWKRRVWNRWPMPVVEEQCAYSLGHMILRGSRMTGDGLKISYHIIYPWLVFPCNTTMLHDEVGTMSEMPQFQCITATGVRK